MTPDKADLETLLQRLANGGARHEDLAIGLAHVIKALDYQIATVRDHDRWIWTAKGGLALTVLFMGLIVYVFDDVRSELRRKIDTEVIQQHIESIDRHLSTLDARMERLRDMMSVPSRGQRE